MATDNIYDVARSLINRTADLTLAEKRKIREMAKILDDQERYNDLINRGGAFSLAEKDMLRKLFGPSVDGGNDPSSTPTDLTDIAVIEKKIGRTNMPPGSKKFWRKFFRKVANNIGPSYASSEYVLYRTPSNQFGYSSIDADAGTETQLGTVAMAYVSDPSITSDGTYFYCGGAATPQLAAYKWNGSGFTQIWNTAVTGLNNGLTTDVQYLPQIATDQIFVTGCEAFGHGLSAIPFVPATGPSGAAVGYETGLDAWSRIMDFRIDNSRELQYGDTMVVTSGSQDTVVARWTGSDFNILATNVGLDMEGAHYMGWDRESGLIADCEALNTTVSLFQMDLTDFTIAATGTGTTDSATYACAVHNGFVITMENESPFKYIRVYSTDGTSLTKTDEFETTIGATNTNQDIVVSPITGRIYWQGGSFGLTGAGKVENQIAFGTSGVQYSAGNGNSIWFLANALPTL